jgi:hypothetical protein
MCNDFGNNIPYSDYLAAFSQTRIPVKWPNAAPNLEPRDDIWPTDGAPVIRRLRDGTSEFSELRWGFPSARPKGPPVINFPLRGSTVPGRSMSGTGLTFFRIHLHEIAKDEVEIHEGRRGLVLLRQSMASHGGGW